MPGVLGPILWLTIARSDEITSDTSNLENKAIFNQLRGKTRDCQLIMDVRTLTEICIM